MYRPNRVGPWPIVDTARQEQVLGATAFGDAFKWAYGEDEFLNILTSVIPTDYNSATFRDIEPNGARGLLNNQSWGIGVTVNGDEKDQNYQYSVTGAYGFYENTPIEAEFIICRARTFDLITTGKNEINHGHILPSVHASSGIGSQANNNSRTGYIHTSIINIEGSGIHGIPLTQTNGSPIIFGLRLTASTNGGAFNKFECSLSIHKYTGDIHVFDPTR